MISPVIKNDKDGVIPDLVKSTITAYLAQIEATKTSVVTTIPPLLPPANTSASWEQVSNSTMQGAQATFETAMKELDRFQVLGNAELEMLEAHRNQMNFIQLSSAFSNMSFGVDEKTRDKWHKASEKKRTRLVINFTL